MIPQKDQFVKILLKDQIQVEGFVLAWNKEHIILFSEKTNSTIVLLKALDNVIFYKIMHSEKRGQKKKDDKYVEDLAMKRYNQQYANASYSLPNLGKIK